MKKRGWIIGLTMVAGTTGLWFLGKHDKPLDRSLTVDKIVVEKSKRRLSLYSGETLLKTYPISLGQQPVGHKVFEGDKRTPEGQYIIHDKNPHSGYYKNLGISYPNKHDIAHAKEIGKAPGGHIKIHGLKNGWGWIGKIHLLKDWTAGCIALTNEEVEELYQTVPIGTPIEIKP